LPDQKTTSSFSFSLSLSLSLSTMATSEVFDAPQPPFDLHGSVALITGGGVGIGLGFAKELISHGAKVVISGRRATVMEAAQQSTPGILQYYVSDAADPKQREDLIARVAADHPDFNILVNNAGVQHRGSLADTRPSWEVHQAQIDTNLSAPLHYCSVAIPFLVKRPRAMIVNVTSGTGFVPMLFVPEYGATKAAVHYYTLVLRASLALTSVRVVEIIPPRVKTDLGGAMPDGADVDEFSKAVIARLVAGEIEIGYDMTDAGRKATRQQQHDTMKGFNARFNPKLVQPAHEPSSSSSS